MTAKFITIDGGEGTGKSTQIELLKKYFVKKNMQCVFTREPGGTSLGEGIRKLFLSTDEQIDDISELLLMFAARNQHIQQKIKPALQNNLHVISDRFTDASFAYQGGGRGIDINKIASLENLVMADFRPDISIFLDLDLETAMARVNKRGDKDRIEQENLDFFAKVRNAYLDLAKQHPQRIRVIDAKQPKKDIHQQITEEITKCILG
jgi:dTMP kinase